MNSVKLTLCIALILALGAGAAYAGPPAQAGTPSPTPACAAGLQLRLIVYERGRVTEDDPAPLNLREGPSTASDILGRIPSGAIFFVLEGPECSGVYAWYRVMVGDAEGWVAEGTGSRYFVEPYLPG